MTDPCIKASHAYQKGDFKTALDNSSRCIKSAQQELRKLKQRPDLENLFRMQISQAYLMQGQIYSQQKKFKAAERSFTESSSFLGN